MSHVTRVDRQKRYYRKTRDCTFFNVRRVAPAALLLASSLGFRLLLANVPQYVQKLHSCRAHRGPDITYLQRSLCQPVTHKHIVSFIFNAKNLTFTLHFHWYVDLIYPFLWIANCHFVV